MQPRSDLWPREEIVFQVTKRGWASSFGSGGGAAGEGCLERLNEKKEELEDVLELVFKAAWDEFVEREEGVKEDEDDEGVDGEGACRRDMLGN